MKQSGRFFPGRPAEHAGSGKKQTESRKNEVMGHSLSLTLVDDAHAFKERGYNPYNTAAHARDTRQPDIWRHKPKRS